MENQGIIGPADLELIQELDKQGLVHPEELRTILQYVSAAERYPETHPIECYVPIPKTRDGKPHQKAFHQAPHKGRAFFGGNQSGKTKAGSIEAAMHFTGIYPDWYPEKLRFPQPNVGRILVVDFPKSVAEILEPALLKAIPRRFVSEWKKNTQGFFCKAVSTRNSRFDVVTHDMITKSLEGWQGDWFWMDEPPPRDKYVATIRGLIRRKGRWWLTATPLDEPWLYDQIFCNTEDFFILTIDIRDNPYLTEEEVAKFESELTEDEKEARLHGKFMHLSGLVYKEFDPNIHVVPATTEIPPEWPRWCIADPHDRRPFAFMWFAVDPLGRIWIYDEWPAGWFHEMKSSSKTLKDYVHILNEMEMGQRIYRRIIDGRACKMPVLASTEQQDTLLDAFDDLGLFPPFEPSYITSTLGITDPGHLKVKEFLRVSPVTDKPSLFVRANCKNVIYGFQHSVWENHRNETKGIRETQSQYAKDFLDLVRYGVMDDPKWMELQDWAPQHDAQAKPKWVQENESFRSGGFGFGGVQ